MPDTLVQDGNGIRWEDLTSPNRTKAHFDYNNLNAFSGNIDDADLFSLFDADEVTANISHKKMTWANFKTQIYTLKNDVWLKAEDTGASAVNVLKIDSSNNTILNAKAAQKVSIGVNGNATLDVKARGLYNTLNVYHTDGTARISIGTYESAPTYGSIHLGGLTPTLSNYALTGVGSDTALNSTSQTRLMVNNIERMRCTSAGTVILSKLITGTNYALGQEGVLNVVGSASGASGGHVCFGTNADAFPYMQILNWTHDNMSINFDAYFDHTTDGRWESSDAGSNYQIQKNADKLSIRSAYGVAAGGQVSWVDRLNFDNVWTEFNEESQDIDFLVRGSNSSRYFYYIADPGTCLINHDSGNDRAFRLNQSSAGSASYIDLQEGGTSQWIFGRDASDNFLIWSQSTGFNLNSQFVITNGQTTFNSSAKDQDFRVNGNTTGTRHFRFDANDSTFYISGYRSMSANITDSVEGLLSIKPNFDSASAHTVTRMNYIRLERPALGGASAPSVTDGCALWLPAALGTHEATTNADKSGNAVLGSIKVNCNGTIGHLVIRAT